MTGLGRAGCHLRPVHERLLAKLKSSPKLFADETTAPVRDPGRGKTKIGHLWDVCPRRSAQVADPPGVAYVYAPDRKAERPIAPLAGFAGIPQVDGYGGCRMLADKCGIVFAFCWDMCASAFTNLLQPVLRRSPAKRSGGSLNSTESKTTFVGDPTSSAVLHARTRAARSSSISSPSFAKSSG